jgi:precorrin-2 dehydrogenase/sirohydrochlorin ferrochelatase
VIAATDSAATNSKVARDAHALGALVNVVDRPAQSDFIFPAVAQKGDVAIAVSTGGASPTLARKLKDEIASTLDDAYADLAWVLAALRPRAMKGIKSSLRRREFFEALADDRFLDLIRTHGRAHALAEAERLLDDEVRADPDS